ncbi:MAG: carboxypeptidase-like regulatory domain-containing protein [Dysgonamonadaceae bacterium]|jgi:hypothetical protein|nr:carboxypeptidase-like regulatory domain-containing protein [Dysgonamonadaceae bacterium]
MAKSLSLAFFFLLTVNLLTAQTSRTIRGTVIDENGNPFPFVNIFLTTSKTGTVTNSQGAFALNLPRSEDMLNVSFMGYETQTFQINHNTEQLNIQLTPSATQLDDFVLTNLTAAALLRRAIEKIPENYRQEPFLTRVYARNKVLEADTLRFIQEMEYNIVQSYYSSFTTETFLVRNRNFRFAEERFMRLMLMGSGVPDIVRGASNTFNARFFRSTDIRFLPGTIFDNRPVFVLSISPRNSDEDDEENIRGRIYLDVESLAFVRVELTPRSGNNRTWQYQKIDDKYFLMYVNMVYTNRRFGRVIPVESEFLTTEILFDFSREDFDGTRVRRDDILEGFATHEQDTVFWEQHNIILPDSTILEAMERYMRSPTRDRFAEMDSVQLAAYQRRLYEPNISLVASTDLLNDFLAINHNIHSLNRLIPHYLFRSTRNRWINFAVYYAYSGFVSIPLIDVSSEWLLLNKAGMQAKTHPTMFNRYNESYSYGFTNAIMSDFKNNNHLDFMRLHTIRNEGRYVRTFLMEEEIAKVNLRNRNNFLNYVLLYFPELFHNRTVDIFASKRDIKASDRTKQRQPLIIDRNRSWVKYLFNPETDYQRHIMQADLSDEEQRYLRRSNRLSWLNLVSPQAFFIPQFQLGDRNRVMLSANYLRTPFGEMFGQNFWLTHDYTQLHGVFLKQYRNYEKTTFGIGYKFYDVPLFHNMYMTSSVDFWQQPADFDFRATSSFSGFRIGQTFEYQFLQNQFSERNRLSFILGYDYKSRGYMPESFFLEENFSVRTGFRWNFR